MKSIKGFTLMEMMVVVLIMALLAGVAYPLYSKSINKSRVAEAISLIQIVREAQLNRLAHNQHYFKQFDNTHVVGNARLIKSGDVSLENAGESLIKDNYQVVITNTRARPNDPEVKSGCIVVRYRPNGDTMFSIYGHVEDNKLWCEDYSGPEREICSMIPNLETDEPC